MNIRHMLNINYLYLGVSSHLRKEVRSGERTGCVQYLKDYIVKGLILVPKMRL